MIIMLSLLFCVIIAASGFTGGVSNAVLEKRAELPNGLERLVASTLDSNAVFGYSVSLSEDGTVALVGAEYEDFGGLSFSGTAYIFSRASVNSSSWSQQAKLVANDTEADANFGQSVSLSSSGTVALIGAKGKNQSVGCAYVFVRESTSSSAWLQQATLKVNVLEANAYFGWSVSLSSDGTVALIGATEDRQTGGSGAAFVFTRRETSSNEWSQQTELVVADLEAGANYGSSVALSGDGTIALVGAYRNSSAFVFSRQSTSSNIWVRQAKLVAHDSEEDDGFGYSVSLSRNGTTALVGAKLKSEPNRPVGAAYVFRSTVGSSWVQQAKLVASDSGQSAEFGDSVALSSDGSVALVGAWLKWVDNKMHVGAAYVFNEESTLWRQSYRITAGNGVDKEAEAYFGTAVALSGDGSIALVGANRKDVVGFVDAGAAYPICTFSPELPLGQCTSIPRPLFELPSGRTMLIAGDLEDEKDFGYSSSMSGDGSVALVGAYRDDENGLLDSGGAYVFIRNSNSWLQQTKLEVGELQSNDFLGRSVSLSDDGTVALVGAHGKDENGRENAGCAFVFTRESRSSTSWSMQVKLVANDVEAGAWFGYRLALSGDGTVALVGAHRKNEGVFVDAGAAYLFARQLNGTWLQTTKLVAEDVEDGAYFGHGVALSKNGTVAMIGAYLKDEGVSVDAGAVYIYSRQSTGSSAWSLQSKLVAANDTEGGAQFGYSVTLSDNGAMALVGAYLKDEGTFSDAGVAYIYARDLTDPKSWKPRAKLVAEFPEEKAYFGGSVALSNDGTFAIIGSVGNDEGDFEDSGAAYVFVQDSNYEWTQASKITSGSNSNYRAYFGMSVDVSGDGSISLIGSARKDVNGFVAAGAVYPLCSLSPNCPLHRCNPISSQLPCEPLTSPSPTLSSTSSSTKLSTLSSLRDESMIETTATLGLDDEENSGGGPNFVIIAVVVSGALLLILLFLAFVLHRRRRRRSKLVTLTNSLSNNFVPSQPNRSRNSSVSRRRAASRSKIRPTDLASVSQRSRSSSKSSRRQSRSFAHTDVVSREQAGSHSHHSRTVNDSSVHYSSTELQVVHPPSSTSYSRSPHYSPGPPAPVPTYAPAPVFSNKPESIDRSAYGRSPGGVGVYDEIHVDHEINVDPSSSGYGRTPGGAGVYQKTPLVTKGAPGGYFQLSINWECASCKNVNLAQTTECTSCRQPRKS